jgi:hypothetical protein
MVRQNNLENPLEQSEQLSDRMIAGEAKELRTIDEVRGAAN